MAESIDSLPSPKPFGSTGLSREPSRSILQVEILMRHQGYPKRHPLRLNAARIIRDERRRLQDEAYDLNAGK